MISRAALKEYYHLDCFLTLDIFIYNRERLIKQIIGGILSKDAALILSAQGRKTFSLEQQKLLEQHYEVDFRQNTKELSDDELIDIASGYRYLGITRRPVKDFHRGIIDKLYELKGIAIFSTGYEWVDVDYLRSKGIVLSYLPEYAKITVAEHTLSLILMMGRRLHLIRDKMKNHIPGYVSVRGWDISGKTIGIIGMGRIGKTIAFMLSAFNCKLIFHDIAVRHSESAEYVKKSDLLQQSDIIIIIASARRNNPVIIGDSELFKVKNSAVIVNTARPQLVDNNAIAKALLEKRLSGYAVDDSFITEVNLDKLDYGRIIETGHTAWYSTEAIERGVRQWTDNLLALNTDNPINMVLKND